MKTKFYLLTFVLLTMSLILTACMPPASQNQSATDSGSAGQPAQPVSSTTGPDSSNSSSSQESTSAVPHVDVLDVTHLPLGDNKVASSPQRGYVYSCMTQFNGKGAQGSGPWVNGDGTWDLTKKVTVDGSVTWPYSFTISSYPGGYRLISSNELPDHATGNFPISPDDDAYQYDRNPNAISSYSIQFKIPMNPQIAARPTCVGGEIGIMLSGVLMFSAFDAEGRDAPAHEVQDQCGGHPQKEGYYHYHSLSPCIPDNESGASALLGYAFDGFGIYGPYDANGRELTDADLDECHGATSEIEWEGQKVVMYHYVVTREFPYVLGCFKGTPSVRALTAPDAGQNGVRPNDGQNGGPGGPQGGQPPEEAISACANQGQGASCSFTTPNGQINGTCMTPPQSSRLVCVPAGGPPAP